MQKITYFLFQTLGHGSFNVIAETHVHPYWMLQQPAAYYYKSLSIKGPSLLNQFFYSRRPAFFQLEKEIKACKIMLKYTHSCTLAHNDAKKNMYKIKSPLRLTWNKRVWSWQVPLDDTSVVLQSKSCTLVCGDVRTDQDAFWSLQILRCYVFVCGYKSSISVDK